MKYLKVAVVHPIILLLCSKEDYFVDGTKFEANAGKYTHVWRKNTERFSEKVSGNKLTAESLRESAALIADRVNDGMSKSQRRKILLKSKSLLKEADKLGKYEEQQVVLEKRNSYSKTDEDATFMRLKNDLLRAAYNVQAGTQNSYVTGFSVSQNANDAVTLGKTKYLGINAHRK